MEYFLNPTAKPRMTRSDKWKKRACVVKYWGFKDRVKDLKIEVPNGSHVDFFISMPPSWSKKKQTMMENQPHTQTPDIDNLLKALLDCVYGEDKEIWSISAEKRWRTRPGIRITPNFKRPDSVSVPEGAR